ncbi:MAG: hypothetical protein JWM19_5564 [Actinomycetia bacterium]|nr:hypothetical protein [Actinomycetes bacterium]
MTATAELGNLDEQKMRDIAEQLEADNPLWMVMFGVYSRQFVAAAQQEEEPQVVQLGPYVETTVPSAVVLPPYWSGGAGS